MLSLAVHGCVLAFFLLMGTLTGARLAEHNDNLTVAEVEVAGASHPVEIPLPTRLTAAETSKPERYADAAVPPTLTMRQLKPQNTAGGGAPPTPHAGEGRGRPMETGATTKMRGRHFLCLRRSRQ
jgi:hypothetical protein